MTEAKSLILIVDDDEQLRKTLAEVLKTRGYETIAVGDAEGALEALSREMPNVAVIDLRLGTSSGLEIMRQAKEISPLTECIVLTGHATRESAIEAVNLGAYSYVQKPYNLDDLLVTIRRATEKADADRALLESEEKHRILVEQSLQGMVVAQGLPPRLVFANRPLAEITGYGVEELLSLSPERITGLIHPEDRELFFQRYRDRLQGKSVDPHYELRAVRKDGSVRWVEIHASRIEYGGEPAVQAVFVDITDRKQAESELRESYETVRTTLLRTVNALAAAVEKRDPYTAGHQRRVADLAVAVAKEMGLPRDQIDGIHMAGLIHDVGKIYVPAEILSKPRTLTEIEMMLAQTHPQAGHDVLSSVDFPWPVADAVLQHHERLDGSGYPRGLSGDEISVEARVLAVADVLEAMVSHRPYRPAHSMEEVLEQIRQNRGMLYDPDVVDTVLQLMTDKGYRFLDE